MKKAKPGARVLAVHPTERNDQGPYVIMAAGSFGDGPVFFCGTDEIWRWFYEHGPKYAHQFWGNMVRWLGRTRLSPVGKKGWGRAWVGTHGAFSVNTYAYT